MANARGWVDSAGLRLSVRVEGDAGRPVVLLVHGYPDNSSVWDGVARRLAGRFRVVRYDLRGFGQSDEPAGRDGYLIEFLVADLAAVAAATSPGVPVHLVGHDWGSILAWAAVGDPRYAKLFASYTSISGPGLAHLDRWMRAGLRRPASRLAVLRQVAHSWYLAAFQVPVLPELAWRMPWLRRRFHATYRDARNGVRLYRANMFRRSDRRIAGRTEVPVLQVALTRDRYCLPVLLGSAEAWCHRLWRRELAAGHWAIRTAPDPVARYVTEFVEHVEGGPATMELARSRIGAPVPRPGG